LLLKCTGTVMTLACCCLVGSTIYSATVGWKSDTVQMTSSACLCIPSNLIVVGLCKSSTVCVLRRGRIYFHYLKNVSKSDIVRLKTMFAHRSIWTHGTSNLGIVENSACMGPFLQELYRARSRIFQQYKNYRCDGNNTIKKLVYVRSRPNEAQR
jgi:hypothetical protein